MFWLISLFLFILIVVMQHASWIDTGLAIVIQIYAFIIFFLTLPVAIVTLFLWLRARRSYHMHS